MPAGVNGAGKTTQLQIITGELAPDGGEVVKAKGNMRIAYLTQEFDVKPTRTVRSARDRESPSVDCPSYTRGRLESVSGPSEVCGQNNRG